MVEALSAVWNEGGKLYGRDEEFVLDIATKQLNTHGQGNFQMSSAQRRWAVRILERNGVDHE